MDWQWKEHKMSIEVTQDAMLPVRLPDPLWRKPLVALGVLKPRYRAGRLDDLLYGGLAAPPKNLGGLANFIRR